MDTLNLTPNDSPHFEASALMSLALDGLLSSDEEQQLHQHLQACSSCQATWQKWQHIGQVLTVEPFAGPPQGFSMRTDHILQRAEQRRERLMAGVVLVGGTVLVTALILLAVAGAGALWMALSPDARIQATSLFDYLRQFAGLAVANLASIRDAVAAVLPSPAVLLLFTVTLMAASLLWVRVVLAGNSVQADN